MKEIRPKEISYSLVIKGMKGRYTARFLPYTPRSAFVAVYPQVNGTKYPDIQPAQEWSASPPDRHQALLRRQVRTFYAEADCQRYGIYGTHWEWSFRHRAGVVLELGAQGIDRDDGAGERLKIIVKKLAKKADQ